MRGGNEGADSPVRQRALRSYGVAVRHQRIVWPGSTVITEEWQQDLEMYGPCRQDSRGKGLVIDSPLPPASRET